MPSWYSGFRSALRALWRTPGFTLSAILTLALGLAGALGLATVVHGVILRQVQGAILEHALLQVAAGTLLGAALAAALGRVVTARLFDTPPTDPRVLMEAILTFYAAAGLASLVPALRAARMDPSLALRSE